MLQSANSTIEPNQRRSVDWISYDSNRNDVLIQFGIEIVDSFVSSVRFHNQPVASCEPLNTGSTEPARALREKIERDI